MLEVRASCPTVAGWKPNCCLLWLRDLYCPTVSISNLFQKIYFICLQENHINKLGWVAKGYLCCICTKLCTCSFGFTLHRLSHEIPIPLWFQNILRLVWEVREVVCVRVMRKKLCSLKFHRCLKCVAELQFLDLGLLQTPVHRTTSLLPVCISSGSLTRKCTKVRYTDQTPLFVHVSCLCLSVLIMWNKVVFHVRSKRDLVRLVSSVGKVFAKAWWV